MARRIEIGVTSEYADYVRDVLECEDKCGLGSGEKKSNYVMEFKANEVFTVFNVTVPGGALNELLTNLKKFGIGFGVGTVAIYSLDSFSPRLVSAPPLQPADVQDAALVASKARGSFKFRLSTDLFPGFKQFQTARFTTEEIYTNVLAASTMTINTWFNLIGAIIIAAGGLISNYSVFLVAAMLVSPLMGPILGMTFGLRIADWKLFSMSLVNEVKMATTAWLMGVTFGLLLVVYGDPNNGWPGTAIRPKHVRDFDLVISIFVSAAAGLVLGVNVTTGGVNSLVGVAMSAGLMPPIVNCGMLMAYCWVKEKDPVLRADYIDHAWFALSWYSSHVIAIIVVSNIIFWMKRITHKFKSPDDHNYLNLPSVQEYNERLASIRRKVSDASLGSIPDTILAMGVTAGSIFSNLAQELSGRAGSTSSRSDQAISGTTVSGIEPGQGVDVDALCRYQNVVSQTNSDPSYADRSVVADSSGAEGGTDFKSSSMSVSGDVELADFAMDRRSEGGELPESENAANAGVPSSDSSVKVRSRSRTGSATETFYRNCAAATASMSDTVAINRFMNSPMNPDPATAHLLPSAGGGSGPGKLRMRSGSSSKSNSFVPEGRREAEDTM